MGLSLSLPSLTQLSVLLLQLLRKFPNALTLPNAHKPTKHRAHDVAHSKQHKSISASDVLKALELIEFGDLVDKLQGELTGYFLFLFFPSSFDIDHPPCKQSTASKQKRKKERRDPRPPLPSHPLPPQPLPVLLPIPKNQQQHLQS